jgi:hypothetical protein
MTDRRDSEGSEAEVAAMLEPGELRPLLDYLGGLQ